MRYLDRDLPELIDNTIVLKRAQKCHIAVRLKYYRL